MRRNADRLRPGRCSTRGWRLGNKESLSMLAVDVFILVVL